MLYGMIDIGSNTLRLAIYLIEGRRAEMLMKKKELVGLAGYVRDGVMQPEGIARAAKVLQGFQKFLQTFRITQVVAFTTAALRNAKNSKEAVSELEQRTGLHIRVISGEEEAAYDFVGATHDLVADDGLIFDIGGGSTEVVAYRGRQIAAKVSIPLGSLGLRTGCVQDVLPTRAECLVMEKRAEKAVAQLADFPSGDVADVVGIGGTFKGAQARYNTVYNQPMTNQRMAMRELRALIPEFQSDAGISEQMTIQLMKAVPERMHTILPGLIIADALARRFHTQNIIYSDSGVREGFIYTEILKG